MLAHAQRTRDGRGPPGNRLPAAFPLTALLNGMPAPSPLALQRQGARASSAKKYQNKSKLRGQKCQFAQIALGPHAMNKRAN